MPQKQLSNFSQPLPQMTKKLTFLRLIGPQTIMVDSRKDVDKMQKTPSFFCQLKAVLLHSSESEKN